MKKLKDFLGWFAAYGLVYVIAAIIAWTIFSGVMHLLAQKGPEWDLGVMYLKSIMPWALVMLGIANTVSEAVQAVEEDEGKEEEEES